MIVPGTFLAIPSSSIAGQTLHHIQHYSNGVPLPAKNQRQCFLFTVFQKQCIKAGVVGTGFAQNGEQIVTGWARNPDGYFWANRFKAYAKAPN